MNKKAVFIGFIIGLITTLVGITIYTIFIGLKLNLPTQDITNKLLSTSVINKPFA